jgi:hypothetical protein
MAQNETVIAGSESKKVDGLNYAVGDAFQVARGITKQF